MPKKRMKRHAVAQPLDESYRLIPLTQGKNAIVDAADFEWLNQWNWNACWNGNIKNWYARRTLRFHGPHVYMHAQIAGENSDHINRDTLDNRRRNLRKATASQNQCNHRKRSDNTSGFIGVVWDKRERKWSARIGARGKTHFLGYFSSAKDAAEVRDSFAKRLHGEFASLN
jgi:hypothetical protein